MGKVVKMTVFSQNNLNRRALAKIRQRICEDSLYEFCQQAWHIVEPSTPFVGGWHLKAITEHLEAVTRGDIRRLIINIPPRHMKSLSVGVFWFCWSWIHQPSSRWLYSSYSHYLSTRDNMKARAVIESDWYQKQWGDKVKLRQDANTAGRFENVLTGFRMATGVGGSATGEGGDFIIVDDPHKAADVYSDTQRQKTLMWWDNTMSTRLNDPKTGRFVVVMQRLHEQDLAGWLLSQDRDYDLLCIPAEYDPNHPYQRVTSIGWEDPRTEEGQVVWPERYGVEEVDSLKRSLGNSYNVSGQLQQNPVPAEGGMFDRATFSYYSEADGVISYTAEDGSDRRVEVSDCWMFQTIDTAMKTKEDNNYTVVMTFCITPDNDILIYDVARERVPVPKQYKFLIEQRNKHPQVSLQAVEDRASGIGLLQEGRSKGTPFKPLKADGDKVRRAMQIATAYDNGQVYHKTGADWLDEFEKELMFFPNSVHDDQVDCLAYGGILSLRRSMGRITSPLVLNDARSAHEPEKTSQHSGTERMRAYIDEQKRNIARSSEQW